MNTPVSYKLARLLKDKNIHILSAKSMYASNGELTDAVYDFDDWCFAPTIAEVVMWLYEKHGIWIGVQPNEPYVDDDWCFIIFKNLKNNNSLEGYNSLTEAYEAAIEYTLNNLI